MKKKFYETKSFKALNKEWQVKLKETGFVDTESAANIEADSVTKQEFKVHPAWVAYNYKCEIHLNSGLITDALDAFIFSLHCEGVSNVEITKRLPQNGFEPMDRRSVDRRLLKILKDAEIEPVNFGSV